MPLVEHDGVAQGDGTTVVRLGSHQIEQLPRPRTHTTKALEQSGRAGGEAYNEAQTREQYFRFEEEVQNSLTGRLVEETTVGGVPAVVPEVTGRAWITGMGQYLLDADDPFPAGFAL